MNTKCSVHLLVLFWHEMGDKFMSYFTKQVCRPSRDEKGLKDWANKNHITPSPFMIILHIIHQILYFLHCNYICAENGHERDAHILQKVAFCKICANVVFFTFCRNTAGKISPTSFLQLKPFRFRHSLQVV
jgi:hypothetical protein